MKLLLGFVSFFAFFDPLISDQISTEDTVMVLTNDNFKEAISANEFILVEFYAPWCGHCKKLTPEYTRAAEILAEKNSVIRLAKIDAQVNRQIGDEYGVKGYPTLKYFRQGLPIEYKGGRKHDLIVSWVEKSAEPPALPLSTLDDLNKFIDDNEVVVVGFYKDKETKEAKNFLELANNMEDIVFGIVNDENLFDAKNVAQDGIVLFKSFDEKRNDYKGDGNVENIEKFIRTNSLPLVIEFEPKLASNLFAGEIQDALFLFVSSSSEEYSEQKEMALRVGKDFKGKVMVILLDADDKDLKKFLDILGMQKEELPGMRLMHGVKDTYGPDIKGVEEEHVRTFLRDYFDGKLAPRRWLKSVDVLSDWDKRPVKELVGRNFHEVIQGEKNVFVMFYAPWCGVCKELAPIWEELGTKFIGHEEVIIAKMDATTNELVDLSISSYPYVKIFKSSIENSVDTKQRTLDSLMSFLRAHHIKLDSSIKQVAMEHTKDEL